MTHFLSGRKKDLKVGIPLASENREVLTISGIVSATKFVGDGSGLENVVSFSINQQQLTSQPVYFTFADSVGVSSLGISTNTVFIPSQNRIGIGTTVPKSEIDVVGVVSATQFYGDGSNLTGIVNDSSVSFNVSVGIGSTTIYYVDLPKTCVIQSIGCGGTSWIRLYNSLLSSNNDVSREIGFDPSPGSGVILEVRTVGIQTINLSPTPILTSAEYPRSNSYPIRITNQSSNTNLNISISYIKLEQ